jgi:hypothetical protein
MGRFARIRDQVMPAVGLACALGTALLLATVLPDPLWIAGVYDGADADDLAASIDIAAAPAVAASGDGPTPGLTAQALAVGRPLASFRAVPDIRPPPPR